MGDKDEKKLKKKEKKKEAEKMLMKIMMENPSMLKEMAEKLQTTGTGSGTTGNASKSRSSRSPSSPSKSADHSSSSRKYKSPTRNVIAHGDSIKVNLGRNSSPSVSRSSASRKVISSESSSNRKVIPQTSSTTGDSKNRRTRSRSRSNSRDHESSKDPSRIVLDLLIKKNRHHPSNKTIGMVNPNRASLNGTEEIQKEIQIDKIGIGRNLPKMRMNEKGPTNDLEDEILKIYLLNDLLKKLLLTISNIK